MRNVLLLLTPLFVAVLFAAPTPCEIRVLPSGRGDLPDEEYSPLVATGFGDNNGFSTASQFEEDKGEFEQEQTLADGLGPVFNNSSCVSCHHHPVTGGSSVITELRVGKNVDGKFVEHPGGSLIHARAIDPSIVERVFAGHDLRGLRTSPPIFGLGFVEAIDSNDITTYQASQPPEMRGEALMVAILEAPGATRVGRFGLKCQHASLLSFAADADLNEIGRTSSLLPKENTSNGRNVSSFDRGPIPNDDEDVPIYARFMRSLAAPPPDSALLATDDAKAGRATFKSIGCAVCHREEYTTAPAGTKLNNGTFEITEALGGKTIRPYSDFLLHDVGTGDGIVQAGGQSTANKFRTQPLWGLRVKSRLGHANQWFTRHEAILGHGGEAAGVVLKYKALSTTEQRNLILFLRGI